MKIDPDQHSCPRLLQLGIDAVFNTAFCFVLALAITYIMRIGFFWDNLVFSLCVGTLALIFIDGSRLLLWGNRQMPRRLPFIGIVLVALPLANHLGNWLAIYLLDLPPELVFAVKERHRTSFLMFSAMAGLVIIWFFWTRGKLNFLEAQAQAEKARSAAIEKQALQAQLQLLQAQIEPHMLFNTLANLQGLIALDPTRAQHMLDQLILYLRATLSSSRAEQTTLEHEFSLLKAYLGLMSVRMGTRLAYTVELPQALEKVAVPPMLLQPIVENSIKHGLEPKVEGGHITVRAQAKDGALKLTVADTGLGLDLKQDPTPKDGCGVGVANVRERLQALYGDRASFILQSNAPSGAIAQLTLPLT
ncbi:MAG: histidine kinase [Burkholderiales bacterium]|nr:histidine kinase [Burkholderiales bacterium]